MEISARSGRAAMMILAVTFSVGALVSSVEISATASRQIGGDIAASTLDTITVEASAVGASDESPEGSHEIDRIFPEEAEAGAESIDGVVAAGLRLNDESAQVRRAVQGDGVVWEGGTVGVTTGYLAAVQASSCYGREMWLDGSAPVAMLGRSAAKTLDVPVTTDPTGYVVNVDGVGYQVVDYVCESPRVDLGNAVILPYDTVTNLRGSDTGATLTVRTEPGAGAPVAKVVTTAVRPDAPQRLKASAVVSVEKLRVGVDTQLGRLAAGVGAFLFVLTCLLIANSMVVSVVSRTGEIGLRRALGASRSAVAAVFWVEGAVMGVIGGLTGSALAMCVATFVSLINEWSPAMTWGAYCAGPLVGGVMGLVACAYPAARAARVSPAVAVRSD